jgi:predicted alpha-1,2-mannosidase
MRNRWQLAQAAAAVALVVMMGEIVVHSRAATPPPVQPADYVNPFVGTAASPAAPGTGNVDTGDTFPGAVMPNGMLAWSPDNTTSQPGGYNYGSNTIHGFSLTHFSGRGCPYEQDVPIMPVAKAVSASPASSPGNYTSTFSHTNESAHPGYYQVALASGINAALSATTRTGIGQFTFPKEGASSFVINTSGSVQGATASNTTISPSTNTVSGSVTTSIGCGTGNYTLYYVAQFDRPFAGYGTWSGATVKAAGTSVSGTSAGAYLTFDTSTAQAVNLRTAISYVSLAGASANLAAEDPAGDISSVSTAATAAWNALLGRIQVTGGTTSGRQVFYTALYHSLIHPSVFSDADGRYLGFDGNVHTLTGGRVFYSNIASWDQYRTNVALGAVLRPKETSDIVQSLVDDAAQGGGGLPRWVQANHNSAGTTGDSPDAYVAQAYAFGARNFDTAAALSAMDFGASNPIATSDGKVVRDSTADFLKYHYVPDHPSRTLEYSVDDNAISLFAAALGNTALASKYQTTAKYWQNTFDPNVKYAEPKSTTGAWDATSASATTGFIEGTAAQWTWVVPDFPTLISKLGGNAATETRLGTFTSKLDAGDSAPNMWIGNEPSEWTPYVYDYTGSPAQTQKLVRDIELQTFSNAPGGIPGNDDGGGISSWYVWSAMGLFPGVSGTGTLLTGSPLFTDIIITPESGAAIHIVDATASDTTPTVSPLTLNGQAVSGTQVAWSSLAGGATLVWGAPPTPSPTPAVAADLNGDGRVNVTDLSILLSHWAQTGTAVPGDINGDGVVNITDLSSLLTAWTG